MTIEQTPLKDCFIIHDKVHRDARGYFIETYNSRDFKAASELEIEFVQDNQSRSSKGVLRGFHMQKGAAAQAQAGRPDAAARKLCGALGGTCSCARPPRLL